jgi:hypothetical protein
VAGVVNGVEPGWCLGKGHCTVNESFVSVRRRHRGEPYRVGDRAGAVAVQLVADPDGEPKIAVTASAWAQVRTAELRLDDAETLAAHLLEQVAVARGEHEEPPGRPRGRTETG